MKPISSLARLSMLLALGALPAAQDPHATAAKPEEALAPREHPPLSFPVTGLTAESAESVKEELRAMKTPVHRCTSCALEQGDEGSCPKCQAPLQVEQRPMFTQVETTAEGPIRVRLDPLARLQLARIEALLAKHALELDDEQLVLPGRVELVVKRPPASDPTTIARTLRRAGLFETAKARPCDEAAAEVVVGAESARAPTRARVSASLESIGCTLADVVWAPVPPHS